MRACVDFLFRGPGLPFAGGFLALAMCFLFAPRAEAGFRANFDMGLWGGTFEQTSPGGKAFVRPSQSLAIVPSMGAGVGLFFLEYNMAWFFSRHVFRDDYSGKKLRDASYFSYLGATTGIALDLEIVKTELRVGAESGSFSFATGTKDKLYGTTLKGGLRIKGPFGPPSLLVEYRRHFHDGDRGGDFPKEVKSHSNIIFVGIGF